MSTTEQFTHIQRNKIVKNLFSYELIDDGQLQSTYGLQSTDEELEIKIIYNHDILAIDWCCSLPLTTTFNFFGVSGIRHTSKFSKFQKMIITVHRLPT